MSIESDRRYVIEAASRGVIPSKVPSHKIVIVVGAGAVENAWQPVIRALRKDFFHDKNLEFDGDCANSYLARIVYLLRFYSAADSDLLVELMDQTKRLKKKICAELKIAQDNREIKARPQLKSILEKFVFKEEGSSFLIVNANWDTVMDKEIIRLSSPYYENLSAIHIHGDIATSGSLYLPSEVTIEPYRTEAERSEIGGIHRGIWEAMEKANTTILYGLSLDPLDAELCQTLAVGWSSPENRNIIIIDPQHDIIAKRVRLLADVRYNVNVIGYSPDDLNSKTVYKSR